MNQIPCPDGYLLDSNSALADGHHALNQYLVRVEEMGWKIAGKELNALRDRALKLRIWRALLERLSWLRANSPRSRYFSQLHDLTYSIEQWRLSLTEADLLVILQGTAQLAGCVMPYTPMPHLMAYVEEHGLTEKLSTAIRDFGSRVRKEGYKVNQVRCQLLNSRLDMLDWRDEWNEIDLSRCWSEQIRAEYRLMQGARRENWRRLLYSIEGDEGVRPAPKWLRNAQAHVQAVGAEEFRTCLMRWFQPLCRGISQRLSREGSFILRSFIWLAHALKDPELLAKVSEIPDVQFTPKKYGEKVIRAAAEVVGKTDPTAKAPGPFPSLDALTARALAQVLSADKCTCAPLGLAERVWIEGEIVYVRGNLDTYRMHISTGAVFRLSDGKRVRIATDRTPFAHIPGIDIGGVAELLAQIFILAEDSRQAQAFSFTIE